MYLICPNYPNCASPIEAKKTAASVIEGSRAA
jgi:hypothetical protein